MRLNRNTRIGLALIGVALLVWMFYGLRNRGTSPDTVTAENNAVVTDVQPVATRSDMVAFVVKDIPDRSIITADMLEMRRLPGVDAASSDYVPNSGAVVGYITRRTIPRGVTLRRSDLLGHISEVGISGAVRPGFRAMSVAIPNKSTLHDLVKVGDYVDVLAAFDQQESRAIVRNVRVLAVDVFGKDFPQVKIAQRGEFKAEPEGVGTANPGTAPGTPGATVTTTTADGRTVTTPAPTPTPAPANNQPPPKPEPSLTLEVTPDQATAIQLAQAATAPLDYLLHPRPATFGAETRVAASIRPSVAPYAESVKRRGAAGTANRTTNRSSGSSDNGNTGSRGGGRSGLSTTSAPSFVMPPVTPQVSPAPIPEQPQTYSIPVYGDGKLVRQDVVLKPAD